MKINFVQVIVFEILLTLSFAVSQNKTLLFVTNKNSTFDAAINVSKIYNQFLSAISYCTI